MEKKKKIPKPHYVDNKKFYQAIVEHHEKVRVARENGLPEPRLSNYIGECIWKIALGVSTKPCFMNYSFVNDMISDGVENCINYFNGFNPEKGSNPFAYFTEVIKFAFIRRINKEERNRYITYKNFQETIINSGGNGLLLDHDDNHLLPSQMYDNITEFMDKFEAKEKAKKEKRKKMKEGLQLFYEDEVIENE